MRVKTGQLDGLGEVTASVSHLTSLECDGAQKVGRLHEARLLPGLGKLLVCRGGQPLAEGQLPQPGCGISGEQLVLRLESRGGTFGGVIALDRFAKPARFNQLFEPHVKERYQETA